MSVGTLPEVRGRLTRQAPLAPLVWFKAGGNADILFEPADDADLQNFMRSLPAAVSVWPLGLGSNCIIRDGGVRGAVVRLGKAFSKIALHSEEPEMLICGGGAPGIKVASFARDNGLAGLEFLRGIPGTVGGAVRMNAGAYGRECVDTLVSCDVVLRSGERVTYSLDEMGYAYRHSELPDEAIVIEATFRGKPGDPQAIGEEMDRIAAEREASQPLRTKTGGSTFKNPDGHRAWQLVDAAGCRGFTMGAAQVSEKHTNFLINLGGATAKEIEALGEEVRRRVREDCGVELQWEIQRIGEVE